VHVGGTDGDVLVALLDQVTIVRDHAAAIHDEVGRLYHLLDGAGEAAEFFPVGRDEQHVSTLEGILDGVVVGDFLKEMVLAGVEEAFGFMDRQRIVSTDFLDAASQQGFHHFEGREPAGLPPL